MNTTPKEAPRGKGFASGGAEIKMLVLLFGDVSKSPWLGLGHINPAQEGAQGQLKCLSWFQSCFSQRASEPVHGSRTLWGSKASPGALDSGLREQRAERVCASPGTARGTVLWDPICVLRGPWLGVKLHPGREGLRGGTGKA